MGGASTVINSSPRVTTATSSDAQILTGIVSEQTTPVKGAEPHIMSPLMIFQTPPKLASSIPTPNETNEFNSFQFWRSPISSLPLLEGETGDVGTTRVGGRNADLSVDLFGGVASDEVSRGEGEGEEEDDDDCLNDIKDELLAESEGGVVGEGGVAGIELTTADLSKLKLIDSPIGSVPNGFPKVGGVKGCG